jgi:ribosome-binding factor A
MKGPRSARVAEEIREELATILAGEADDPRLRAAMISSVEVSSDLRRARVLLATPSPEHQPKEVLRALRKAAGYLRHQLAQILNLRRMPELLFEFDEGARNAERIETLLGRVIKGKGSTLGGILIAAVLWSAVALRSEEPPKLERYEASASIMGSVYRIAAFGPKRGVLASVIGAAFEEGRRIDGLLSNYRDDSELCEINRRAASGAVNVSPEMGALLAQCLG